MSMRNLYGGLVGTKVVVITIQREDIERRDLEQALASLNRLIDSREALEASNGTISLMVSGYDNDPRELHLIPEVRAFFQELDEQFPFWFHVCTRIEHSLRMIFAMLADLEPVALDDPPGAIGYQFSNDDLNDFVGQRMIAMRALHATHKFDVDESERIADLVISYFSNVAGA
ncbi:chlororespiratory reduction 6 domain-containing protein [Noviherbaspirillum autotrophicum]|nr:chlororespiratory reduction 6 domain-containing protein [Noviherbaspirillum autotrophicum]